MIVTEDGEKHSVIWGMFMSSTLESSVFMGKNYSDNWHSIKNTKDLTMKQMFDISTRLVSGQDEIYGVKTIGWESHSWKYLSLIGDEQVISFNARRFSSFQILYCVLVRLRYTLYRNLVRIDGESIECEWNIFPGFNALQLGHKVQELLLRLNETPETFT